MILLFYSRVLGKAWGKEMFRLELEGHVGLSWLKMAFQLGHGRLKDSQGHDDIALEWGSDKLWTMGPDVVEPGPANQGLQIHSQSKQKPSEFRNKAVGSSDPPIRKVFPVAGWRLDWRWKTLKTYQPSGGSCVSSNCSLSRGSQNFFVNHSLCFPYNIHTVEN